TNSTRLDFLMRTLEVSGKDISARLGVDETTVSKWRKSQRKLAYKSKYTPRLAEIFLSSEVERKRNILPSLLKSYKSDLNLQSRQQQIETLGLWLTEETVDVRASSPSQEVYTPINGYNTSVSVFKGEEGIDEALEYFMKSVLGAPSGKTLYVVDFNGIDWTGGNDGREPQKRVNLGIELFKDFIENGQKFVIIDCDTDIYKPYMAIFRWMRLYLMGGVEVLTHPPLNMYKDYFITFVLRDELVLHCSRNPDFPEQGQCLIAKNKETVNYHASMAESISRRSRRLIETVPNDSIADLFGVMGRQLRPGRSIQALNPTLTLYHADRLVLRDILARNNVPPKPRETCLALRDYYEATLRQSRSAAIVDLDGLDRAFTMDMTVDHALSAICQKEILVTRDQLKSLLGVVADNGSPAANSMVFVSFSDLGITPAHLSIFVQDDTFVSVWDMERYKKSMYCTNIDVISGFYRCIDVIWHIIPGICKESDWRNKQLRRFIETF
ncbi:MAG: hypothetical protein LBL95_05170, partial [Deltaproteobacteria bacterium]|nr:hypothetical protein [Deltaproteobacteria bacterium]